MRHGIRHRSIQERGFTLIELMVVLTIIGLLAALAATLYQDYVNSTQVRTLYAEVAGYKTVVEERITDGRNVITNDDIGFTQPRFAQPVTNFVTFRPDGTVSIGVLMGGDANPALSGVSVSVVRSVAGSWGCGIDGSSASGWKDNYRPQGC